MVSQRRWIVEGHFHVEAHFQSSSSALPLLNKIKFADTSHPTCICLSKFSRGLVCFFEDGGKNSSYSLCPSPLGQPDHPASPWKCVASPSSLWWIWVWSGSDSGLWLLFTICPWVLANGFSVSHSSLPSYLSHFRPFTMWPYPSQPLRKAPTSWGLSAQPAERPVAGTCTFQAAGVMASADWCRPDQTSLQVSQPELSTNTGSPGANLRYHMMYNRN